ncbi:Stk1 family PASTA domain-containing Ser/Thr kinase [Streptomyces boncukensis]|uniref:non-specific serine/threonine protein kinase n=1 Tax=Streptomyces boncukensis TaxID=2711219 RepID=A0A6G4X186_9ACTN|nr:Stk1 family PASTA domain-containing Ser/Thr kinase [Streptomyces boncukensis]NGO71148.1 Stk1 family PASTA domain-containing Ser/Thr kinase [Streptomyces boncukensis]
MDTTLKDPMVGRVLDRRYRVDARIAVGGMATVYRAMDTRLDRVLALKVMHPSLSTDEAFVGRFIREAKSAARLSHTNVVGVYDQGTDGTYVYLAMEYVAGCTLRDVLRDRGALQPRAALDIVEPVLAALGAAHRAGLVHRDVKPENVLIGDDGRVKVADFGLVRAVDSQSGVTTDSILGTVSYLAPEQIEHGTADTRADLYACGVMLHEMLTGAKPHSGGTPAQVLYQHLHEDVPAPSALAPGVGQPLDALVARAAARHPEQRPADAVALLSETRAARGLLTEAELDAVPPAAKGATGSPVGGPEAGAAGADGGEARTSVIPRPVLSGATEPLNATTRLAPPPRAPEPGGGGGGGRGRRRPRPWMLLSGAALLLVLLGVGIWYINSGQFTKTPAVLDKPQAEAAKVVEDAGLDVRVTRDYSQRVKRGRVIDTKPEPGERIRHTGTVTLVVSRGPEIVKVPDVKRRPLAKAREALKGAGLEPGVVKRRFSEDVPSGSVITTDPTPGTERSPGSAVALSVSKGAPVEVPDVVGDDEGAARDELRDAGLKVKVRGKRVFSKEDEGTVARQSPADGAVAAEGDTVTLTVSKGPDMVEVPDVEDKSEDEARRTLEGAGFKVKARRIFFGDTVFNQSPGGGDEAPRGSEITVWLR